MRLFQGPMGMALGVAAMGGAVVYPNIISNGDFESSFTDWTQIAGDGAIAVEATLVHGGTKAAKLTCGPVNFDTRILARPVTLGNTNYRVSLWTLSDGVNEGYYSVYDNTNGAYIKGLTPVGTSAVYTNIIYDFTTPADCIDLYLGLWVPYNTGLVYFDDVTLKQR